MISLESVYTYMSDRIPECLWQPIVAVEREGVLYALREKTGTQTEISNIWIMEVETDSLRCFWNDYEITIRRLKRKRPLWEQPGSRWLI